MDIRQIQSWYEAYRTGIYRFALSILKEPAAAEDVLQETFLRLLQGEGFRFEPGKERAWLYRVARNICYDHLRKAGKEQPEVTVAAASGSFEFMELIAPLSPIEQEILSLKILGNLTHGEIASVLRLTVHGTKKRYERAIHKLRLQMKEDA